MNISTKTGRDKLPVRREPYWARVRKHLYVGYRVSQRGGEGSWIARYQDEDGRKKYKSLEGEPNRHPHAFDFAAKEAVAWADSLDRGIENIKLTVAQVCENYIQHLRDHRGEAAASDAESRLRRLVLDDAIGRVTLTKLTAPRIRQWLHAQVRRDTPETERSSKATANRVWALLRASLNLAYRDQLCDATPWKAVKPFAKVDARRTGFLTIEDRRALLQHAEPDIAVFITALLLIGCRPGEAAAAKVADFDAKTGSLLLSGKTGPRQVTLSTAAKALCDEQSKGKTPAAPLFARADGKFWTTNQWKIKFRRAADAAGLPQAIVPYSLRHAAITSMVEAGLNPLMIAASTGTSLHMIQRHYFQNRHVAVREQLDAVQQV